jgi:hypothetical protein
MGRGKPDSDLIWYGQDGVGSRKIQPKAAKSR